MSMVVSVMTLSLRSSMQVTLTGLDSRKLTKTSGKHRLLGIWGCLKRWLKHFFGDVGSKMAFFGHLESTCGTCWRQDGQQDGQDGQHEGQDGVKIATEHFPMCF